MGEIADDMIDGASCSWCGVYFSEEHGYPVACESCWDDEKERNPKEFKKVKGGGEIHSSGVQKAIFDEA